MHRLFDFSFLSLIAVALAAICFNFPQSANAADDEERFPILQGLVTDSAGILSVADIESIGNVLKAANDTTGLDGRVVISSSTSEWYLAEFAKDYGDFLQTRGIISPTGWLIYISTEDRKFALAVQGKALVILTPVRRREIELILDQHLEQGDIAGGVLAAVKAIDELPALEKKGNGKKPITSPNNMIFIGLAVVLFTLAMRSRRTARSLRKK